MVEKNHKSRLSSLFRFRRKSKEEISKEEIRREVFLDLYTDILSAGAEVLFRIPYYTCSIHNTAKKIEIESKLDNPIGSVFGVGGLASRRIGHMEDYKFLLQNISTLSEDVLREKLFNATQGYDDFDGFLVLEEMPEDNKKVVADIFKKMLPPLPEPIRDVFSYEFHDDCIKVKKEFQNLVESSKNHQYIPMLKKHELEILDPDPNKKVIPTVLYINPQSELNANIQGLISKGQVRTLESYYNMTFLPWAQEYKASFLEKANEIIENVRGEIANSGMDQNNIKSCMDVYSKL